MDESINDFLLFETKNQQGCCISCTHCENSAPMLTSLIDIGLYADPIFQPSKTFGGIEYRAKITIKYPCNIN